MMKRLADLLTLSRFFPVVPRTSGAFVMAIFGAESSYAEVLAISMFLWAAQPQS